MDKRIEDASKVFDMLYRTNSKRFAYLPNWQKTTAYWFQQEYNNKIKSTYKKYERGAIVYIDFGVNIGHEFSGRHFGIVLNKKDSPYNSLLTVVPLTSKSKQYYLPLNNIVFKTAIAVIESGLESIKSDVEVTSAIMFRLINIIHKHSLHHSMPVDLKNTIDKFAIANSYPNNPKALKECERKLQEYDLYNNPENFQPFVKVILSELRIRQKKMEDLDAIIIKYQNFNKNTYACTQNIVTISKLRIHKINDEDPSKKMKIDDISLNLLDERIKEQLFF